MYLSIATTHRPATDLGFLLHKHPDRLQEIALPFGRALAFYPEATAERCEFALAVEVDPVAMVREREGGTDAYVNDRPYAASSFLSTAVAKVLGTARTGRCDARPDLAATPIPLEVTVAGLRARDREAAARMFEPLGYGVAYEPLSSPSRAGDIPAMAGTLTLSATARLADVLDHLYVLVMAIDGDRHTFVDDADLAKLAANSAHWLDGHPMREVIVRRLGKNIRSLGDRALAAMGGFEFPPAPPEADAANATLEARRRNFVVERIAASGEAVVADLGCGEGKLLRRLADMPDVRRWIALDASTSALARLRRSLAEGRFAVPEGVRVEPLQGMLTCDDPRLAGVGVAVMAEVVEHVDPTRLPALEAAILGRARPRQLVVTTPNAEYNATWGLAPGTMRHPDHRFEWTRCQFEGWLVAACAAYGYSFETFGVGEPDPELGSPTQAAVLTREGA